MRFALLKVNMYNSVLFTENTHVYSDCHKSFCIWTRIIAAPVTTMDFSTVQFQLLYLN